MAKDLLVSVGWCAMAMVYDKVEVNPSFLGKTATALQYLTVCAIVLCPVGEMLSPLEFMTALFTLLAMVHYGWQGVQLNGSAGGKQKPAS